MAPDGFTPALIVVDLQEDFCPPNGSLAVPNGRDIIPTVNELLELPFAIKICTKDWHPASHTSFAANHEEAVPFTSFTTIPNPSNSSETYTTRLWPVHCVQNTDGAAIVAELQLDKVDRVLEKGQRRDVEMYSAFYDPFVAPRVCDSGLTRILTDRAVTDVFVVGLAADYCVRATALDAHREGWRTWIVEEGTRPVDEREWVTTGKGELIRKGVGIVGMGGEEIGWVLHHQ